MIIIIIFFHRYGAILEKFQQEDDGLIERIKGCIVDSAPVAAPDPQVEPTCSYMSYLFAKCLMSFRSLHPLGHILCFLQRLQLYLVCSIVLVSRHLHSRSRET